MRPEVSTSAGPIVLPMIGVLAASVILGLAFNSTNPLGVRAKRPAPAGAPQPTPNVYANETLSFVLNKLDDVAKSAYQNEVLAMTFTPPLPGARPVNIAAALASVPTPTPAASPGHVREINWPQVNLLLEAGKVVLVDARAPSYYQADHIPGAVSLPFNAPPADMAAFQTKYPKNSSLVVYCGNEDCALAHRMAENLIHQHGYADVAVLSGGYAAWRLAQAKAGTQ